MAKTTEKFDLKGREKAKCSVCGRYYHRVDLHVKNKHGLSVKEYRAKFPEGQLYSEYVLSLAHKDKDIVVQNNEQENVLQDDVQNNVQVNNEKDNPNVYKIGVARLNVRNDLNEIEKLLVPSHNENWVISDSEMTDLEDLALGIEDGENIYIGGPTGCGKTATVLELACYLNQPVIRIQLKRDFKVSNFVGRATLEIDQDGNQITGFQEGPLPKAFSNGYWLLCDEIDQAHPDVLMELQAILEGKNDLVITEDFGRTIKRHKDFRIIATANTFGAGDNTGLYAGAKVQNEATLDRFGVTLKKDYPTKEVEIKILSSYAPSIKKDVLKKMVEVAHKVRESAQKEECFCTFSTRRLIAWAKKSERYGDVRRASKVSVLNKLSTEDSNFIDALIQRYFGGEV